MKVKTKTKMRKQKKKTEKKLVKTNGERLRRGIDSNTLPKRVEQAVQAVRSLRGGSREGPSPCLLYTSPSPRD